MGSNTKQPPSETRSPETVVPCAAPHGRKGKHRFQGRDGSTAPTQRQTSTTSCPLQPGRAQQEEHEHFPNLLEADWALPIKPTKPLPGRSRFTLGATGLILLQTHPVGAGKGWHGANPPSIHGTYLWKRHKQHPPPHPPSTHKEGDTTRGVFSGCSSHSWLFLDQGNKQKDSTLLFLGGEGLEGSRRKLGVTVTATEIVTCSPVSRARFLSLGEHLKRRTDLDTPPLVRGGRGASRSLQCSSLAIQTSS